MTRSFLLASVLLGLPHVSAAADCDEALSTRSLQSSLDAAEAAFGRADLDGFSTAVDSIREALPCLDERAPAPMAAQLHRVEGLSAFVDQANERAAQAFAAARSIEPTYTFPSSVVPPGNPVHERYLELEPSVAAEPLPLPTHGGEVLIDGRSRTTRPTELPTLLQVLAEGSPTTSAYLWPADPLPYEASARAASGGVDTRTIVLASGVGVAAIGLGTLVAGLATSPSADDTLDQAFAKSTRDDTLTGIGGALAAVGGAGIGLSFALPSRGR